MKSLVPQEHWDKEYDRFYFYEADDCITEKVDYFIDNFIEKNTLLSCFEIGCFPGRYLAHFCKKYGLSANGVDATDKMKKGLKEWLESEKITVGELEKSDAFSYIDKLSAEGKKYDLVYSFGFVEHFINYKEVIKYHAKIVSENGLLVIVTPNFGGGLQRVMHCLTDRENMKRHNLKAMNPGRMAAVLKKEGFEIIESGCFGGFKFWAGEQRRGLLQRGLLRFFRKLSSNQKTAGKDCRFYSPYCILVAARSEKSRIQ
jgi:2-polyprenyl-3-methyl-5-hydroxy-6-metoxy-1,4-benzoquinol methylase